LRRQADEPARGAPIALRVVPENANRAARLASQAYDRVDRGGFSGTVRAEKAKELAGFNP